MDLTQLLTGRDCFDNFLKRMKLAESAECGYCEHEDSVQHTILVCPRWNIERTEVNEKCGELLIAKNIDDRR